MVDLAMSHADAHDAAFIEESDRGIVVTRLKRPNQKQHNKDLADVCTAIEKLLDEQKVLLSKERAAAEECRKIRAEKSTEFYKKQELEAALKSANLEMVCKRDGLAKLQVNLHYKNEARLDEAIRRLEAQLGSYNFKLSDEKKVAAEIDSLKRSKSTLAQYNQLKEELDNLKQQQNMNRAAREEVFQTLSALKMKEDYHSRERTHSRSRSTDIQAELDILFDTKRKLKSNFSEQKRAYNAQKAEALMKAQQHAQDKAQYAAEQRRKTQAQTEVVKNYGREHHLCCVLLQYLRRLAADYLDAVADPLRGYVATLKGVIHEVEGMKLLQKESAGAAYEASGKDNLMLGSKKKTKKKRKHRLDKRLCHTPEVISWFIELGLSAPATAADISSATQQLNVLKLRHESAPILSESLPVTSEVTSILPESTSIPVEGASICPEAANSEIQQFTGPEAQLEDPFYGDPEVFACSLTKFSDANSHQDSESPVVRVTDMPESNECHCQSSAKGSACRYRTSAIIEPAATHSHCRCLATVATATSCDDSPLPHSAETELAPMSCACSMLLTERTKSSSSSCCSMCCETFDGNDTCAVYSELVENANSVLAMCNFEGKSFIHQTLALTASGAHEDVQNGVTIG